MNSTRPAQGNDIILVSFLYLSLRCWNFVSFNVIGVAIIIMLPFLLSLTAGFKAGSIPIITMCLYLFLISSIAALVAVLHATTIALTFLFNKKSIAFSVRFLTSFSSLVP